MTRRSIVKQAVSFALSNATLTTAGLAQLIHSAQPDIKHVAFIKTNDLKYFTIWVKYNDRKADVFNFMRGNWSHHNA